MNQLLSTIEQNQIALVATGAALVVLLLAFLAARAVRHHRQQRAAAQRLEERGRIRRPVHIDTALLADLRAKGFAGTPDPASTTINLESDTVETVEQRATEQLDRTLRSLQGTDVLADLDADPDRDLHEGEPVLLTGTLTRHRATDAIELLELAAPILARGNGRDEGDGATGTATAIRPSDVDVSTAPMVVHVEHPTAKGGYLMVLRREHLHVDDPIGDGSEVSILAVVERLAARRETLTPDTYLTPHLTRSGRQVLGGRDLTETVERIGDLSNEEIGSDELDFRGPGAILTPAAIYR